MRARPQRLALPHEFGGRHHFRCMETAGKIEQCAAGDVDRRSARRLGKDHGFDHARVVAQRRQQNLVLALEIVEERPARDAGGCGDLVERGRVIALGQESVQAGCCDAVGGFSPLPLAQAFWFWRIVHEALLTRPFLKCDKKFGAHSSSVITPRHNGAINFCTECNY
ncbi:hypothetical protein MPL3356_220111 [Mesorhizobium plurifarium]|uniref:Uncharacterized protein n=1 Tax=Mesorhizobium plurifarium TaxID=69974 RepID=A0A090DQA1_MESPL|nr:hypothetical protein MPL3356_220111 [Mesorhizobium plurifarium]